MGEQKHEIKPFLRVFNTDLDGNKGVARALLKVKGIGFSLSSTICNILGIDKNVKAGLLSDADARRIEDLVNSNKLPNWMLNHRKDFSTGEDKQLIGVDLKFVVDNYIKLMRRLKTYKGMRHASGQPVRGQRTRSHFRSGRAVGVQKSKVAATQAAAKASAKKGEK